jgi:transcriptional regulator with XRE-family HTH domain
LTGGEFKARRLALNLTRAKLAAILDVTYRTVLRWEAGDVVPTTGAMSLCHLACSDNMSHDIKSYDTISHRVEAEDRAFADDVKPHWEPDEY